MELESAMRVARQHLQDELPRRWKHVQAVAAKADRLRPLVQQQEGDLLCAAAWLHDIGYASPLTDTGFHALDGARWLLRNGASLRLAGLVAHHSCASYEAEARGLARVLETEFTKEQSSVSDALWYCDMTTGPDGQDFSVGERLAEIRSRYGPDHLVTRFWAKAEPALLEAVKRTQDRMAAQPT